VGSQFRTQIASGFVILHSDWEWVLRFRILIASVRAVECESVRAVECESVRAVECESVRVLG
jgi:hypothetical protein